jgi:hypothetical protein
VKAIVPSAIFGQVRAQSFVVRVPHDTPCDLAIALFPSRTEDQYFSERMRCCLWWQKCPLVDVVPSHDFSLMHRDQRLTGAINTSLAGRRNGTIGSDDLPHG